MRPSSPQSGSSPRPRPAVGGVSRRDFLKGLGTTAVTAAALSAQGLAEEMARANAEAPLGPGAVPVTLTVNGERRTLHLEPRVTLLEALRDHWDLTGAKESCDRATCGACTVLLDDVPVYACSLLAIDVQGAEITTIEGLSKSGELTKLQQALVAHDGLQCGFCTPGFVMSLTALLRRTPHPTEAEVRQACAGHLCRCGSYPRIFSAALAATAGTAATGPDVIHWHDHALA